MSNTTSNVIFYAHSGGVTPTINAIAAELIEQAQQLEKTKVIIGKNGIVGLLEQALIDTEHFTIDEIRRIKNSPASAFGSARFKLPDPEQSPEIFAKILAILDAHGVTAFVYNGGNDSQDTTEKLSRYCSTINHPLRIIGIPKTIDNDLASTDVCPGYASTARYLALSMHEASLDLASMCKTSTKVFIMEVMGRHSGWLAAATIAAQQDPSQGPHIVLVPEIALDETRLLELVQQHVNNHGYCCITASEGLRDAQGQFFAASTQTDAFGHQQLGGVAPKLAHLIERQLSLKTHAATVDYLQRAARHAASQFDLDLAQALAQNALSAIQQKQSGIMLTVKIDAHTPTNWRIQYSDLKSVANHEKTLPDTFYDRQQMRPTQAFLNYITPLVSQNANLITQTSGWPDYIKKPYDANMTVLEIGAHHD